ncbi:MAG: hypothetical protein AAF533_13065 [Acidobacteriota bacterium]
MTSSRLEHVVYTNASRDHEGHHFVRSPKSWATEEQNQIRTWVESMKVSTEGGIGHAYFPFAPPGSERSCILLRYYSSFGRTASSRSAWLAHGLVVPVPKDRPGHHAQALHDALVNHFSVLEPESRTVDAVVARCNRLTSIDVPPPDPARIRDLPPEVVAAFLDAVAGEVDRTELTLTSQEDIPLERLLVLLAALLPPVQRLNASWTVGLAPVIGTSLSVSEGPVISRTRNVQAEAWQSWLSRCLESNRTAEVSAALEDWSLRSWDDIARHVADAVPASSPGLSAGFDWEPEATLSHGSGSALEAEEEGEHSMSSRRSRRDRGQASRTAGVSDRPAPLSADVTAELQAQYQAMSESLTKHVDGQMRRSTTRSSIPEPGESFWRRHRPEIYLAIALVYTTLTWLAPWTVRAVGGWMNAWSNAETSAPADTRDSGLRSLLVEKPVVIAEALREVVAEQDLRLKEGHADRLLSIADLLEGDGELEGGQSELVRLALFEHVVAQGLSPDVRENILLDGSLGDLRSEDVKRLLEDEGLMSEWDAPLELGSHQLQAFVVGTIALGERD